MNYQEMAPIDLVMELKSLSRSISALEIQKKNTKPETAEHFVEVARIDAEIEDLNGVRVEIGKVMLKQDQDRKARETHRLEQQKARGAELASEITKKLPGFAELVKEALTVISNEFAELQTLSKELRTVNSRLMNGRVGNAVTGANHIEPNGLNKILKKELARCFGLDIINYKSEISDHDIVENVKNLTEKVSIKELEK